MVIEQRDDTQSLKTQRRFYEFGDVSLGRFSSTLSLGIAAFVTYLVFGALGWFLGLGSFAHPIWTMFYYLGVPGIMLALSVFPLAEDMVVWTWLWHYLAKWLEPRHPDNLGERSGPSHIRLVGKIWSPRSEDEKH